MFWLCYEMEVEKEKEKKGTMKNQAFFGSVFLIVT